MGFTSGPCATRRHAPVLLGAVAMLTASCELATLASIPAGPATLSPAASGDLLAGVDAGGPDCLDEGRQFGLWNVRYHGFGCVRYDAPGADPLIALSPAPAAAPELTHAALVVGPQLAPTFELETELRVTAQLRAGSAPNPWEAAWLVWDYVDDDHFYYFILKPNGWELGKRDPAYPGGQRFLATGESPRLALHEWTPVRVVATADRMSVSAAGVHLADFTDLERPHPRARVALYTEDAAVEFRRLLAR